MKGNFPTISYHQFELPGDAIDDYIEIFYLCNFAFIYQNQNQSDNIKNTINLILLFFK